ncbi:hypothetical protein, partial [Klebsiella michiganensis]|uniref:hypothetical protein n=1 Tax=Klebsiella michiganensis TaxID=1134687 RepID=UPI00287D6716
EWVHVQLHQQKGMISLSPPTICNSAGSCAAPSAKGDDKFITTDYLQQCPKSDSVQDALFMKLVEIHFQRSMQSWPKRRLKPTFVIGYRKYKPPFCSSSEVSYLKFPHSFTAQAPILTAGPA